ncbi:hypothetical protein SAMN05421820_104245 [Pedobacter steynii]|uniref:Exostosin family protein n=1 Tax=Pedobacter steynii TaxID=430522 RepID=A0A1G9UQ87_9SPHI|nr:hypothetical protein [Pedobacter steynii]NQX40841.1 hypothetical protein [Pedobacter steynii]SDM62098.1 hypothetical protein SAMN05421820_104245 [Pedobacter steynii]
MIDLLQLNKFGSLHNNKNIVFCKTDFLVTEFKAIQKIKNEVILISGNSDFCISPGLVSLMPDNIHTWYCQNNLVYHDKLRSLPIGLENSFSNKRPGHGVAWQHVWQKIELLNEVWAKPEKQEISKLLYANFNIKTNIKHRSPIKEICAGREFITLDEPNLDYATFIDRVLAHEATLCPIGNGIDTHRLYEVLYCRRIPVTIKSGDYPIYSEIYDHLPIVILENALELRDREKLQDLIGKAKEKPLKRELLDYQYWDKLISGAAEDIPIHQPGFFERLFSYKA